MEIDQFNVSEKCRRALKRAGFSTVEDIVQYGGLFSTDIPGWVSWFICYKEVIEQLQILGLISSTALEDKLDFDDMGKN